MSSATWQQFLISQGAQFNESGEAGFISPDAPAPGQLFDLSTHGLIAVSGADALTFLQGQFTNDIKLVQQAAQFTGYCTAKGRLLALFYAFSINEIIYLQCPRTLIPELVKRLRMFVMRSKVLVEDVSEQFVILGLASADSAAHIQHLPLHPHHSSPTPLGSLIRLPDSHGKQRAQLIIETTQAEHAWKTLAATFTPADSVQWDALEIQAGIPQVYKSTQEKFVPQMVNLDALDGINFKKGCYTGQEIVARTHYLGKVKRRTQLAILPDTATAPAIGDPLLDAKQQEAGQLVRVAPNKQGGWWVLAECRLEAQAAGSIYWQEYALGFSELPYTLA
ncbi:MAG: CAF17-like 4Fe-4S cluster assembly/insertion protein YgfZ [Methylophilus sp.]|uniref:CAF17-like 4Fe-4S cluster assembly/insertion protein YgfZ n=1 Tax=Methylophilus sp. TaxID=29541 RepID=UPI003FA10D2E